MLVLNDAYLRLRNEGIDSLLHKRQASRFVIVV